MNFINLSKKFVESCFVSVRFGTVNVRFGTVHVRFGTVSVRFGTVNVNVIRNNTQYFNKNNSRTKYCSEKIVAFFRDVVYAVHISL